MNTCSYIFYPMKVKHFISRKLALKREAQVNVIPCEVCGPMQSVKLYWCLLFCMENIFTHTVQST
jgi:hypothetical protein